MKCYHCGVRSTPDPIHFKRLCLCCGKEPWLESHLYGPTLPITVRTDYNMDKDGFVTTTVSAG